ncbi:MAG: ABC transporter ATP-binding protein [Micrococcales bacterium]|nr:MAG: ABC transporter ATP-binding protein [Micrococcales bacterium]
MTGSSALRLRGVNVEAGGTRICTDVRLDIKEGEVHVLFGPNGSGKSSLLAGIMGLPPYEAQGTIELDGRPIHDLSIDERARRGLGMAFQRPPRFEGVTVAALVEAMQATGRLDELADSLDLAAFTGRILNKSFSGGEVKRWEVLKLALQLPRICLFDEPESGVDLEHIQAVGQAIDELIRTPDANGRQRSALIITHTGFILDYIEATHGHVMLDGRIAASGNARDLFATIARDGYQVAADPAARKEIHA